MIKLFCCCFQEKNIRKLGFGMSGQHAWRLRSFPVIIIHVMFGAPPRLVGRTESRIQATRRGLLLERGWKVMMPGNGVEEQITTGQRSSANDDLSRHHANPIKLGRTARLKHDDCC